MSTFTEQVLANMRNELNPSPEGAEFLDQIEINYRAYQRNQEMWKIDLIKQGVVAAHPDDGWVDRGQKFFRLVYPEFIAGVIKENSLVALGNHHTYRLVRITRIEQPKVLQELLPLYYYEDVSQ